jgi:hypothetical protein
VRRRRPLRQFADQFAQHIGPGASCALAVIAEKGNFLGGHPQIYEALSVAHGGSIGGTFYLYKAAGGLLIGLANRDLSQNEVARLLKCDGRMVHRWSSDKIEVSAGIARWLKAWVVIQQAHPDSAPPEDWHR